MDRNFARNETALGSRDEGGEEAMKMFGSCCRNLSEAMETPPTSLFRVEDNGVLYMAVGYTETENGMGWFDQAVLFCPFCGAALQTPEDVKRRSVGW